MRKFSKKEELILFVLYFIKCIYGRTYFQKLFFLIQNELLEDLDFGYIKYHYGPFSEELNKLINGLVREGLVQESISVSKQKNVVHCYRLSKRFSKEVEKIIRGINKNELEKLKKFCDEYDNYTPSELLKYVYLNYPEWTINSLLNNQ